MHDTLHGRGGHLAGLAALTILMIWPALWSGAPTVFFDSATYYEGGGEAVEFFLDRSGLGALFASGAAGEGAAAGAAASGEPAGAGNSVRSVPYSVYLNLAIRLGGPIAAVAPMALVTAWLLWLMLAPLRPPARLLAGGIVTLATTAPFYAAQLMPDIQAAWLIAAPLVVMLRGGAVGGRLAAALGATATAAILFHYSHIPLAAATGGVLSLWLLWRGRHRAAALAQVPLLLALALNLAMSLVMAGSGNDAAGPADRPEAAAEKTGPAVSIAPGRVPVLLARLLEDGPALHYLSSTCPENGFAICEVYDRLPESSHEALWGPDGIRQQATPAQMRRISAEEMALALRVLAHDPLGQIRASAANTGAQLVRFGLEDLRFARIAILGPDEMEIDPVRAPPGLFATVETVQIAVLAAAVLLLLLAGLRVPAARAPICLLAAGLLANAFVCGALSAPAGRYQGRVIWLVAATALALCARNPAWRRAPWRAPPATARDARCARTDRIGEWSRPGPGLRRGPRPPAPSVTTRAQA